MLSGKLLFHQSKLQSTVALSLTEAEYIAKIEAEKEVLWVAQFLTCFEFCPFSQPVNLRAKNKRAISLTKNLKFYSKTKHIKVCWHRIQEKVKQKEIAISYIFTKKIRANGLIKALSPKMFKNF